MNKVFRENYAQPAKNEITACPPPRFQDSVPCRRRNTFFVIQTKLMASQKLPNCCVALYLFVTAAYRMYASFLRTRALHLGFLLSHPL